MSKHVIKSNRIPSGIYQHVHSGDRLQVDWEPVTTIKPYMTPTAYHQVGEAVVVVVNIIGWLVLATTLFWGLMSMLMTAFPGNTEEVTIEQAE